ncbi:MAG: hypothetical protein ACRD3B_04210 [Candidatus Sulfotelmatobacter sp.]
MLTEEPISAKELAKKFVSGVLKEMVADPRPPCDAGSKPVWNVEVKHVLRHMGRRFGYITYLEWASLDVMWWAKSPERMVLAAESEMANSPDSVEADFEKLPSFKCHFKLLAFSTDVETVKKNAEDYLQLFGQHVQGEEYLLVGFAASGPQCLHFQVPHDGKLGTVSFDELRFSNESASSYPFGFL